MSGTTSDLTLLVKQRKQLEQLKNKITDLQSSHGKNSVNSEPWLLSSQQENLGKMVLSQKIDQEKWDLMLHIYNQSIRLYELNIELNSIIDELEHKIRSADFSDEKVAYGNKITPLRELQTFITQQIPKYDQLLQMANSKPKEAIQKIAKLEQEIMDNSNFATLPKVMTHAWLSSALDFVSRNKRIILGVTCILVGAALFGTAVGSGFGVVALVAGADLLGLGTGLMGLAVYKASKGERFVDHSKSLATTTSQFKSQVKKTNENMKNTQDVDPALQQQKTL